MDGQCNTQPLPLLNQRRVDSLHAFSDGLLSRPKDQRTANLKLWSLMRAVKRASSPYPVPAIIRTYAALTRNRGVKPHPLKFV